MTRSHRSLLVAIQNLTAAVSRTPAESAELTKELDLAHAALEQTEELDPSLSELLVLPIPDILRARSEVDVSRLRLLALMLIANQKLLLAIV